MPKSYGLLTMYKKGINMQELLLCSSPGGDKPDFEIFMTPDRIDGVTETEIQLKITSKSKKKISAKLVMHGMMLNFIPANLDINIENGVYETLLKVSEGWSEFVTATVELIVDDVTVAFKSINNQPSEDKIDFDYMWGVRRYFSVLKTGTYWLELETPGGGGAGHLGENKGGNGGRGAWVTGTVELEAGRVYAFTAGDGGKYGDSPLTNKEGVPTDGKQGDTSYMVDALTEEPVPYFTNQDGMTVVWYEGGGGGTKGTVDGPGTNGKNSGNGRGSGGGDGGKLGGYNRGRGDPGFNGRFKFRNL